MAQINPSLKLPPLGVGTWSWGGNDQDYWKAQKQEAVTELVQTALEAAPTMYFDTAQAYNAGKSETALRIALEALKPAVRARAVMGTKILPEDCMPPSKLREKVGDSCTRLGVKCIDLLMVHWPVKLEDMADVFGTLKALQKEGAIRHIGVSNFGVKQLTAAVATGVRISINQLAYGLCMRAIEFEVLPLCKKFDIAVIGYSPLLQGILTGKFASLEDVPAPRLRTRHFKGSRPMSRHKGPGFEGEVVKVVAALLAEAEALKVSMSSLAIAWCLREPSVVCVLAGARDVKQCKANLRAVDLLRTVKPEVFDRLTKAGETLKKEMGPDIDYYECLQTSRSF